MEPVSENPLLHWGKVFIFEREGTTTAVLQRELDKRRRSVLGAEEELKRVLLEAEDNLDHGERNRRKGRMDSPHSVAQGVCDA